VKAPVKHQSGKVQTTRSKGGVVWTERGTTRISGKCVGVRGLYDTKGGRVHIEGERKLKERGKEIEAQEQARKNRGNLG